MSEGSIQATGLITGSFGSGAMMSLFFVTLPALLDTASDAGHLQSQWARIYHYGHRILPAIAVGTCLLHTYTCFKRRRAGHPWRLFAIAGLTTISIAPFTWIFMLPTNNALLRSETTPPSGVPGTPEILSMSQVRELVTKWAWLHFVRSLLPLGGTIIAAVAAS